MASSRASFAFFLLLPLLYLVIVYASVQPQASSADVPNLEPVVDDIDIFIPSSACGFFSEKIITRQIHLSAVGILDRYFKRIFAEPDRLSESDVEDMLADLAECFTETDSLYGDHEAVFVELKAFHRSVSVIAQSNIVSLARIKAIEFKVRMIDVLNAISEYVALASELFVLMFNPLVDHQAIRATLDAIERITQFHAYFVKLRRGNPAIAQAFSDMLNHFNQAVLQFRQVFYNQSTSVKMECFLKSVAHCMPASSMSEIVDYDVPPAVKALLADTEKTIGTVLNEFPGLPLILENALAGFNRTVLEYDVKMFTSQICFSLEKQCGPKCVFAKLPTLLRMMSARLDVTLGYPVEDESQRKKDHRVLLKGAILRWLSAWAMTAAMNLPNLRFNQASDKSKTLPNLFKVTLNRSLNFFIQSSDILAKTTFEQASKGLLDEDIRDMALETILVRFEADRAVLIAAAMSPALDNDRGNLLRQIKTFEASCYEHLTLTFEVHERAYAELVDVDVSSQNSSKSQ